MHSRRGRDGRKKKNRKQKKQFFGQTQMGARMSKEKKTKMEEINQNKKRHKNDNRPPFPGFQTQHLPSRLLQPPVPHFCPASIFRSSKDKIKSSKHNICRGDGFSSSSRSFVVLCVERQGRDEGEKRGNEEWKYRISSVFFEGGIMEKKNKNRKCRGRARN